MTVEDVTKAGLEVDLVPVAKVGLEVLDSTLYDGEYHLGFVVQRQWATGLEKLQRSKDLSHPQSGTALLSQNLFLSQPPMAESRAPRLSTQPRRIGRLFYWPISV